MNREKVNEWLENTFSEFTKEQDRKESIFYLLKRLQDNHDKEISRLLTDTDDSKNIIVYLQKENTRLKKQLANNHHMECSCSFCKPVGENND